MIRTCSLIFIFLLAFTAHSQISKPTDVILLKSPVNSVTFDANTLTGKTTEAELIDDSAGWIYKVSLKLDDVKGTDRIKVKLGTTKNGDELGVFTFMMNATPSQGLTFDRAGKRVLLGLGPQTYSGKVYAKVRAIDPDGNRSQAAKAELE